MKTLYVYSAKWCRPCQNLKEVLKASDLNIDQMITVDVDDWPDIAKENNIRSVPTCILKLDGVEVARKTGAMTLYQLGEFLR